MLQKIEILGADYEFTLDLSGVSSGFNIEYRPVGLPRAFGTVLRREPFEACEFSLSNYIMMCDRGDQAMMATPVFLNRAFRHGVVLVRKDSPLHSFEELRGRRVGAREYSQTAAVWLRGLMLDDYGVDWRDIRWYCGTKQRFPPPAEANLESGDEDPEDLLISGELDALVAVVSKDATRPHSQRRLRPLLPDPQSCERAYWSERHIYPINHTVVIDQALATRHPGLAQAVFNAYESAKRKALDRKLGATLVPWGAAAWDRMIEIFGDDPMPHGLGDENRMNVGTLIRYLHEQRLIDAVPDIDALFVPGAAKFHLSSANEAAG